MMERKCEALHMEKMEMYVQLPILNKLLLQDLIISHKQLISITIIYKKSSHLVYQSFYIYFFHYVIS